MQLNSILVQLRATTWVGNNSQNITFLSIEWNSIRLGGPARGIVTKTVHKTLSGVISGLGSGWWGGGESTDCLI